VEPEKTPRERAEDLINLLVSDWRPTAGQGLWAIRIVLALIVGLGLLTLVGQPFGITLWDWLKLLVVPAVIAGGGIWFNRQQRERELEIARQQRQQELEIAERRTQDEALQAYLDQMSAMLMPNKDQSSLYESQPGGSMRTVARARTLTVLPRLDGVRKARVVQFLYESGLINKGDRVVDLRGADLRWTYQPSADLRGADLSKIDLSSATLIVADLREGDLSGTSLYRADLRGADLSGAFINGSRLSEAKLMEAYLVGAVLSENSMIGADLSGADLSGANLVRTDLGGANLTGVKNWTDDQLRRAGSLKGATMPNGQIYEDWLKDREGAQHR